MADAKIQRPMTPLFLAQEVAARVGGEKEFAAAAEIVAILQRDWTGLGRGLWDERNLKSAEIALQAATAWLAERAARRPHER